MWNPAIFSNIKHKQNKSMFTKREPCSCLCACFRRAFQEYYQEHIEYACPTEDIYLE